ncbi:hypothetical protein K0M31_011331 [Melipona bicolor]|uniref:Uncharacterized protein n=1 Tax=Melipona bicolor TaxID=60889 RepID=A0AA40G9C2_9HYME|nr:hypothetical protein K0M31_011331 [Melipona bicolor]
MLTWQCLLNLKKKKTLFMGTPNTKSSWKKQSSAIGQMKASLTQRLQATYRKPGTKGQPEENAKNSAAVTGKKNRAELPNETARFCFARQPRYRSSLEPR